MDARLNKIYGIYAACGYNNILQISVFVIPNNIEFSLYSPIFFNVPCIITNLILTNEIIILLNYLFSM